MKIAFNPSTVAALTTPPNNKDITFDLRGQNIFARGVKFCGTDTNTWRDIKINNVSIGSNILDLRNSSNTTLTNTNGVVTINSTWRPVVDNLTSNSTTSSLSANQGRILKALIDSKLDSDHNHDDRYVRKSGDTMLGALNFANGTWNLVGDDSYMGDCNVSGHFGIKAANTTYPGIAFFNNSSTFLGNLTAYSGNIKYGAYSLQFLDNGNTSVSASTWTNPFNNYNSNAVADGQAICVWGQNSYLGNLANDTGDMSLWLKRVNAKVVTLNMVLDGEYYANGNQRLAHVSEIPTSLKNPYALTISLNGTSQGPYDGSAAKNINITPSSIGAATSGHNHDDRYLRLTGGWMSGDINFGSNNKIFWGRNTDSASISFKNDGDGDANSYMSFVTSDNGNEYFRWSHDSGSTNTEWMALRSDGLRVRGTKVSLEGHSHNDLYYTKAESNAKYITDITTSVNKLTFTRNGANIARDITINVVHSQGNLTNISDKNTTTKASSGLYIYNSYGQAIGTNSYSSVLSINTGGTIQIAGNWGDYQSRNLYWRSQSDRNVTEYPWKSWRTILDSENYSSTLDSRYYTESEVNNLLSKKLNTSDFNWTNLSGKIVVGKEFNIVNAGFNETMYFNYLPINNRNSTATVRSYYFGNGHKGLATVQASGFIKAGSSSSYVLLGDGGHKAVSDFASSSHSHNYAANEKYGGFTKSGRLPISGFYQSNESESGGNAPWSSWMHLINCQHSNTGNNYALQIAASFYDNNIFKIRVTDNNVNNAWRDIIHSGNIGSQTVANAYHLRINAAQTWSTWYWSGKSGQPSWLWGSNDGTTMCVWNPSNFRVASATKLQTPRSIWGQRFDGTADVNGTIYINNSNSSNGAIRLNNNVNANARISAIDDKVIFNTGDAIRFGETSWDWNQWAGLKYTHSNKTIYLGIADNSIFNANSAQSGGTLNLRAGISNIDLNSGASIRGLATNGSPYVSYITLNYASISLSTYGDISVTSSGPGTIKLTTGYGSSASISSDVKIESSRGVYLNSGNSGNVYLCQGGGKVGIGTTAPTQKLDVSGNIRATGQIVREGSSQFWVYGRNGALLRETSAAGYHALWSLKTTNGSWDFGEYSTSGWYNVPVLSYITDSNYNSGSNTITYQIKFPLDNGIIALTKNIPTSLPANGGNADTVDGEHASSFVRAGHYESANLNSLDTYSFIKSVNSTNSSTSPKGNTGWYNVIQLVHRNGRDDGPGYIGQIALGMTTNTNDMFFRGRRTDSWKTVIHSGNYTEFINNYYWANVKISTSSSTTTSPTVHTLTATRVCAGHNPGIDNSISCSNWFRSSGNTGWYNTTYCGGWYMSDTSWIRAHNGVGIYTSGQIYSTSSIRMGNIYLEHTDEINNSTNGGINLNYRNSGNVSLCVGGGNVGVGTTSPSYKLDVNGQMRAGGFHHGSVNSDNYILLAGGGYKSFGGDARTPIFLGYLNLDHGDDGTVSSSFYCLGYSVPFTYTRGGNYCRISIPDTTRLTFYINAAIASVNYSGGGMNTLVGVHRNTGAWWLHCYASGFNEVRVKGFCQSYENTDSWWGGNPLFSNMDGANRITVCIFGHVSYH